MNKVAIKVENLSKLYRLGEVGSGSIGEDLNRWWAKVRGKEDPLTQVGSVNDRTQKAVKGEHVWAVKDINFEVEQGEVLGIIGRNGAGKSTLLKLLSKITAPTTGSIKARGRIASLLEVGTGMNPEMTGIENIYLNGTILGMTKREISAKLDDILDFAGCAKYGDTPVKRYSSGMKVRLGFAVAAFLEPEILIVDEVLAVGDAEFQKRAVGKMKEVSQGGGRTVFFVSHNMASVKTLCDRSILLENGGLKLEGATDYIVSEYLRGNKTVSNGQVVFKDDPETSNDQVKLHALQVNAQGKAPGDPITMSDAVELSITFENFTNDRLDTTIQLTNEEGTVLFPCSSVSHYDATKIDFKGKGTYQTKCIIPGNFMNEGVFGINLIFLKEFQKVSLVCRNLIEFDIIPKQTEMGRWMGKSEGFLKPIMEWEYTQITDKSPVRI